MTHLLIWLLAFPPVAAFCVAVYVRNTTADAGQLNKGYTIVYAAGTAILLTVYFLIRYV